MGTWGTAIFADDYASDLRGMWRDGILNGDDPDELTRRLIAEQGPAEVADDLDVVFWLALAAAQMETGRLDPNVRDHALSIIDAGADLNRWEQEAPTLAGQRRRVLSRLAAKLRGPQPAPKRLRRPVVREPAWAVGDAIRLRNTETGGEGLAVVVTHTAGYPPGTNWPVVELLLWEGGAVPSPAELAVLPCIHTVVSDLREDIPGRIRPHMFVVVAKRTRDPFAPHIGDVVAHGVRRIPAGDHRNGAIIGGEVLTSTAAWPLIIDGLGRDWFDDDVQLTRDLHRPAEP